MIDTRSNEERLATIEERTTSILAEVAFIRRHMNDHYVSKEQFEPIKLLVYGLVGVVMSSVILGLVMLLLTANK